jgi:phage-related protein
LQDRDERVDVGKLDIGKLVDAWREVNNSNRLSESVTIRLSLEDLERIDWESVTKSVLGITDILGQLLGPITSAIGGMISGLKTAFEEVVSRIVSPIRSLVESALSGISSLSSTIQSVIITPIQNALNWVANIFPQIRDLAYSFIDRVSGAFSQLASTVSGFINNVSSLFGNLVSSIQSGLTAVIDQISKAGSVFGGMISQVTSLFTDLAGRIQAGFSTIIELLGRIPSAIMDIISRIGGALGELGSRIQGALASVIDMIGRIPSTIGDMITRISSFITDLAGRVQSGFASVIDMLGRVPSMISDLISRISSAVSELGGRVQGIISGVIDYIGRIPSMLGDVIGRVSASLSELASRLGSSLAGVAEMIGRVVTSVSDMINRISTGLTEMADRLGKSLSGLADTIGKAGETVSKTVERIIGDVSRGVGGFAELVSRGFSSLGTLISDWFNRASIWFNEATKTLQALGANFMGFVNAIMQLPQMLRMSFEDVVNFFRNLWNSISEFIRDPRSWLSRNLISPLIGIAGVVGKALLEGISALVDVVKEGLKWLWGRITDIMSIVWSAVSSGLAGFTDLMLKIFEGIKSTLGKFGESVLNVIMAMVAGIKENVGKALSLHMQPMITSMFKELGVGTPPTLTIENFLLALGNSLTQAIPMFLIPLSIELPVRAVAFALNSLAQFFGRSSWIIHIDLTPMGVGIATEFDITKAIGAMIHNFAEELMKTSDRIWEPFWFSLVFWYTRYMRYLLTYSIRNFIPIVFPSPDEVSRAWLRSRVAEAIPEVLGKSGKDIQDVMTYFLKVRGYSDYLLAWHFAEPDKFYTSLIDRFEQVRKIPLGGVWRLPSPSDVARMWVRDVLRPPAIEVEKMIYNLTKVYEAVGMYRDIGLLYTLLAFRYPPPRDLANFYWRGVAGVLWLEDTLEEVEWKKLFNITWEATKPYDLNRLPNRVEILNNMITLYMRWHDYFPAPWAPNFPTDKSIIAELMADLPTIWDLRWMTRYGIFQHLSDAGLDIMADLKTMYSRFVTLTGEETRRTRVTPEIVMDVRMLTRFLIARRLNPLIAPLVASAQIHYVLAPALTLLRTGFIDSVRRGFITLDVSEELMSGLLKMKLLTGYIDPKTGKYTEVVYNKPVFWLPTERRLLQLRAVFDRYNIIMRDLVTRVVYAVRDVAMFPEEAVEIIRSFHTEVSEHIRGLVKSISGIDWKPLLDESYINVWISYASYVRLAGVRTWIRRHISRMIGWVFYRVVYGWITPKDIESIIDSVSSVKVNDKALRILSDEEIALFKSLSNALLGVVKRELIPTPSQLATFAEYMVIDENVVEGVLNHYRIPEEYKELYRTYIALRPIKSDYKTLLTRARSAYVRGVITDDEWKGYLNKALEYGFKEEEIRILEDIARLEELIYDIRGWSPTLLTVITISEYIPEATDLLKYYRIDPRFKPVIEKYVSIRPIVDDVRVLVNTYFRALRYAEIYGQNIPKEIADQVGKYMELVGMTDTERSVRELATHLDAMIVSWRELARERVPTPQQLATFAEYMVIPNDVVSEVLNYYRVPEKYRQFYVRYISTRPLKADYRSVLSTALRALRYNAITLDQWKKLLDDAVKYGFTESEVSLIQLRSELELMIEEVRAWRPSVTTLVTISEYVPEIARLLDRYAIDPEFKTYIQRYITVRPIADDVRVLMSAYFRALRYAALLGQTVPEDVKKVVSDYMKTVGVTDVEMRIRELAVSLEVMVDTWRENAREYVPTPSQLATLSEYVYIPTELMTKVFELRRVPNEWRAVWSRYISMRSIADDVRAYVNAMFRLVEYVIVDVDTLKPVFDFMKTTIYSDVEITLRQETLLAERFRYVFNQMIGTPRNLAYMSRYSDKALQTALNRAYRMIDLLPMDDKTKELLKTMWKEFITNYQAYPEIRSYMTELINAYARGVLDDQGLEQELNFLRNLGVPELRLQLVKRTAQLRRVRYMYT